MITARKVGLRVNGVRAVNARVRLGREGPQVIITDLRLKEFAIGESFTLEVLELVHPRELRKALPNGGWRKVSLRILISLLRGGVIRISDRSERLLRRTGPWRTRAGPDALTPVLSVTRPEALPLENDV